jgi:hypothetical protein
VPVIQAKTVGIPEPVIQAKTVGIPEPPSPEPQESAVGCPSGSALLDLSS